MQNYKNKSQQVRVFSEDWVSQNVFCPCCGNAKLTAFENNRPVADFYCEECKEEFELKSKKGKLGSSVPAGAYGKMLERLKCLNKPNFLFLTYDNNLTVTNLIVVPKQFMTSRIIQARTPLSVNAKRAGWTGCNILLSQIPFVGRISIVENTSLCDKAEVEEAFRKILFLRDINSDKSDWLSDVLLCIDMIKKTEFSLEDVYRFEGELKRRHPNNNNIQAKIRQQLQVLRDKNMLEFVSRGIYRRIY